MRRPVARVDVPAGDLEQVIQLYDQAHVGDDLRAAPPASALPTLVSSLPGTAQSRWVSAQSYDSCAQACRRLAGLSMGPDAWSASAGGCHRSVHGMPGRLTGALPRFFHERNGLEGTLTL